MRICAVVVTYYPNVNETINNIKQYIDHIDHLVIWENTPVEYINEYKVAPQGYSNKISYMGKGSNVGISLALNNVLEYASTNGYTHLLTMDQDSYWVGFGDYVDAVAKYDGNALFGPRIFSASDSVGMNENVFDLKEYLITSGMLLNLNVFKIIGSYFRDFNIDGIDLEISLRAQSYGIPVICVNKGYLIQKYGTPKTITILGRTIKYASYSSNRLYGIVRNNVIILRKYKVSKVLKRTLLKRFFFSYPLRIIYGESNKCDKIIAICRGLLDGIKYNIIK